MKIENFHFVEIYYCLVSILVCIFHISNVYCIIISYFFFKHFMIYCKEYF